MARQGDTAFADALKAIGQAGVSSAEEKFLRRRAVEVFAAAAAAGPPQHGYTLVAFEELRAGLGAECGHAVGLGRLRRWLLTARRPDLVSRVQALVRCRRWTAHPDVELFGEVIQVVRAYCDGMGEATAECFCLCEDELTAGSGEEWDSVCASSDVQECREVDDVMQVPEQEQVHLPVQDADVAAGTAGSQVCGVGLQVKNLEVAESGTLTLLASANNNAVMKSENGVIVSLSEVCLADFAHAETETSTAAAQAASDVVVVSPFSLRSCTLTTLESAHNITAMQAVIGGFVSLSEVCLSDVAKAEAGSDLAEARHLDDHGVCSQHRGHGGQVSG